MRQITSLLLSKQSDHSKSVAWKLVRDATALLSYSAATECAGVVTWGARTLIRRAPYVSNASTRDGVNGIHSLDAIMDLSSFISGGVKHKGVYKDLAQSIGAPLSSVDLETC